MYASGFRLRGAGALAGVGVDGYALSSSPSTSGNVNAGYLAFTASGLYPVSGDSRAVGLPVRCVRAFSTAWKERLASQRAVRPGLLIASGYRHRESGVLTFVGSYGCAWSGTPYASGNANAGYLVFGASFIYPLRNDFRAFGFPVRCVREFTAAWKECPSLARGLGFGFHCGVAVSRSVFPLRATASTRPEPWRSSARAAVRGVVPRARQAM